LINMAPERVVLLVQPERHERERYAACFRDHGWRAISVAAARDALRVAPIADVIVTDILLPGHIDGVEFIAQLKADDRLKNTPVVVLTTCAWNTERERAGNAGCAAFIAKPCLPANLVRAVRGVLALHRRPKAQSASVRPGSTHRARRSS
jgi:two-component system cell cycle response regulator DivK